MYWRDEKNRNNLWIARGEFEVTHCEEVFMKAASFLVFCIRQSSRSSGYDYLTYRLLFLIGLRQQINWKRNRLTLQLSHRMASKVFHTVPSSQCILVAYQALFRFAIKKEKEIYFCIFNFLSPKIQLEKKSHEKTRLLLNWVLNWNRLKTKAIES